MTQSELQVVCALRGGLECRKTFSRAIALALQMDRPLTLFHVVDVEFLRGITLGSLKVVRQELEKMSATILALLRDSALERGVRDVNVEIRAGQFREQLQEFLRENRVAVLVMGYPVIGSPGSNTFTPEEFEAFVRHIQAQWGVPVEMVAADAPSC
ncbi:MAG: universal stress protein [Chloroflexi bacterium]|nr:universal stress protein [Chloroflexota bacterium]